MKVGPEMIVSEINRHWPQCKTVFETHGIAGCGGQWGPPERLDFFARAHEVDLDVLIHDLEEAIEKGSAVPSESDVRQQGSAQEQLADSLYQYFVKAALILTLTGGAFLGVFILSYIAVRQNFLFPFYALTQAHGHVQMFGWVGLFIMGISYHIFPRFKNTRLEHPAWALASLLLMFFGIVVRLIGQTAAALPVFAAVAFISSFFELTAIGIFFVLILKTCELKKLTPYDPYIIMGIGYFFIIGLLNVGQSFQIMTSGIGVVAQPSNDIILHLILMGFICLMILGVSLRILPHFLALDSKLENLSAFVLVLFNLGILFKVMGLLQSTQLLGVRWIGVAGSGLELIAGNLYVLKLGIFKKSKQPPPTTSVDLFFVRFVRLAYAWFCIALIMDFGGSLYGYLTGLAPAHIFIGAYRHAVTVGFITTMIMGVAYRVIPVFSGTYLASPRAEAISFYLILAGNVMRVGGQLATAYFKWPAFLVAGISGYLEVTALFLFGWNLWKTMNDKEPHGPDASESMDKVTIRTPVMKLLRKRPDCRSILIQCGFSHLKENQEVPGFVTIGVAARMHGVDPKRVVQALNEHRLCDTKDIERSDAAVDNIRGDNTQDTLKIAIDAAKNKGISTLAVASTTGETALKLFELTKNEALKIIVVTHGEGKSAAERKFSDEIRKKLSTRNITIYTPRARSHFLRKIMGKISDRIGLPSWHKRLREIKERLGTGVRVCHILARILIKEGLLREGRVIAIAGTKRGADSAALFKISAKHKLPILEEIIVRPWQGVS